MKKKIPTAILLCAVCFLLLGCASAAEHSHNGITVTTSLAGDAALVGNIPCDFPLVTKPETLRILICGYNGLDQADVFVWKKYQEMTGVSVDWTTITKDKRAEAVQTALMNGRDLDLILRCKLSAGRLLRYGESGLLLDLAKDGMLSQYAPNCWAYLKSHPETLASVTNPDGSIYALPQVNSGAELRVGLKLFVNRTWLERVGMGLPTTTEEFYQLLKAFYEQDANGNGIPGDEIPFCCPDWNSVEQSMLGAFGLGNRGMHNTLVDWDDAAGRVRFIAAAPEYKTFLTYLNRLYSEGLLDGHAFTITEKEWRGNIAADRVGVFASTNLAWIPADQTDDWVALEEALEGPLGDKLWMPVRANFHSTGAAAIPATCRNPALVLRWLDYFWTDEGTLFYHMGIEGETFLSKEDGTYDYLPAIYREMQATNQSYDDVIARYSPYPGGSNPTVEIAPYFMGGEMAPVPAKAARALFPYGPKEYWPNFTFTTEENEALAAVQGDIEKYCDGELMAFVVGTKPLSQWDDYRNQLDKLKVSELLDIYQAAVDRYAAQYPGQ